MRVCVLFFANEEKNSRVRELAGALCKGIEKQGHQVDLIDGDLESDKKVTFYEYICIGAVKKGFFTSKLPDRLKTVFHSIGHVAGKRCYAFVLKNGFRSQKTLSNLMKLMEAEGMYLKRSDLMKTELEAELIGKKLHIAN